MLDGQIRLRAPVVSITLRASFPDRLKKIHARDHHRRLASCDQGA
jgi:hypothetical protein